MRALLIALTALTALTAPALAAPTAPAVDLTEDAPAAVLRVTRLAMGHGVDRRKLVGEAETFTARGQRVWAHLTLENPGLPTKVTLVWAHEGTARWHIDLTVGQSPAWRTWARWTLNPRRDVGRWTVEALDATGRSLGTTEFMVVPPPTEVPEAALPPHLDDIGC
ncbi:MAG: DUF2914 domain-containing protein [Myxococcales bacterium]|nr:DUF2914 domain-containing protein [Myxococcales bacterium]